MITIRKIKNLLNSEFVKLCKQYNIDNCKLLICSKDELIANRYTTYKYGYLTPYQMLNNIEYELAEKSNSFMTSEFVQVTFKNKVQISYAIFLLTENIYRLYYCLQMSGTKYTDEELKEFLLICLRHEIGHIIDFQTSIKKAKDIKKWNEKRNKLKYKEMKEYFDYRNNLYRTFDEDGPNADYNLCKLEVTKYFNMTAEATANKLAELDIDRMIELTIKFQAMIQEWNNM